MALGLILIAMIGAIGASALMLAYGFSIWIALLAYPVTGFVILLPGVLLVAWVRQHRPDAVSGQMVTSQSPAGPHPPSRTGSSNP